MIRFSLALIFYWYEFLIRVAPAPMFKSLMVDLSLDAQAFGLLSSSFLLPYALLQIPFGLLLDRLPTGKVLGISCLFCTLSTLGFSYADNYLLLLFFRTLSGVGSAVAVLACMKIAITEFPKSYFGIFAGVILFIGGLGAISGKILLSICLEFYHWRTIMFLLSMMGLILTLLIFWSFDLHDSPLGPDTDATSSVKSSLKVFLAKPLNLAFGFYALLMTAPSDAFAGLWSSVYFSQVYALDLITVEFLGSMVFIGMALGSPIVTYADHFFQKRFQLAAFLSILSALIFFFIVYTSISSVPFLAFLCLLYGVVSVYVLAFVMAQQYNDVKISGLVSGFINTLSIVGSFSLQTLIGMSMTYFEPSAKLIDGQFIYQATTFHYAFSVIVCFYIISAALMSVISLTRGAQSRSLHECS